ncbi:MAG: potassium-transporting ATPase subunit KdpC [Deltaproteobacteria bacterium]|nr:potassium-transporting ATPase subunit KdpC [Deltaproteobacteria bacterium]
MFTQLRPAAVMLALMTLLTGALYPLLVTGASLLLFPHQARGSLVVEEGRAVASELIGQCFSDPRVFWGRPSATTPNGCNAASSNASNLGPTNPALVDAVKARVRALREADPGNAAPIPIDLVTTSASGLDPHVSPAAALFQVPRVARLNLLEEARVRALVLAAVEPRTFGLLGEPRVNVVLLNRALQRLAHPPAHAGTNMRQ